jgi:hypothetical protein
MMEEISTLRDKVVSSIGGKKVPLVWPSERSSQLKQCEDTLVSMYSVQAIKMYCRAASSPTTTLHVRLAHLKWEEARALDSPADYAPEVMTRVVADIKAVQKELNSTPGP